MFTQPPLDIIFSKWAELIVYVEVLENSPKPGQRHDALVSALAVVCTDLSQFIDDRYTQLHVVATSSLPRRAKKRRNSQARSQQYVEAGRQACRRLGQALDQVKETRWRAEDNLVAIYDQLVSRLGGVRVEPLTRRDLPKELRGFCKRACALAGRFAQAEVMSNRERMTAGMLVRKGVTAMLIVGGIAGLEQDVGPFAEDVAVFVHTLFEGLDYLVHDPDFVFDLPGREIRPLWRGEWAIGGPTRSVAQVEQDRENIRSRELARSAEIEQTTIRDLATPVAEVAEVVDEPVVEEEPADPVVEEEELAEPVVEEKLARPVDEEELAEPVVEEEVADPVAEEELDDEPDFYRRPGWL